VKSRNPALLLPLAFAVVVVLTAAAGREAPAAAGALEPEVKCLLNQFVIPRLPLPGSQDTPDKVRALLSDDSISITSRITLLYWASNPYVLWIDDSKPGVQAIFHDAEQVDLDAAWKLYLARSTWRIGFFRYLKQDPVFAQECFSRADKLLDEAIREEPQQSALYLEKVVTTYWLWRFGQRAQNGTMPSALPSYPDYDDALQSIREYIDAPLNQHPAAPPYVEWLDDPLQCEWPAVQGLIGWMMPMRDSIVRKVAEHAIVRGDEHTLLLLLKFSRKYADTTPEGYSALYEAVQCAHQAVQPFCERAEETGNPDTAELLSRFLWDTKQLKDDMEEFRRKQTDARLEQQSAFDYIVVSELGSVMVRRMIEDEREVKQAFLPRFNDLVDRMIAEWEAHMAAQAEDAP
jgi:hypothetical protein